MEAGARAAFTDCPPSLGPARGFLGLETFTAADDAALFYLVTRWADDPSFRAWRSGSEHSASHWGIPKGLKIDPAFTQFAVLDRVGSEPEPGDWEEISNHYAPLLADHISRASRSVHCIVAGPDGTIQNCNAAAAGALGRDPAELIGSPLWEHLSPNDVEDLLLRLGSERMPRESFLLNFVVGDRAFSLDCTLDVHSTGFMLLGEPPAQHSATLQEQMFALNNQLAVLSRENESKRRALATTAERLEQTLEELHSSYWHLKRLQEVLPICLECGKVRTADHAWDDVISYLRANALFLSHTYCPDCLATLDPDSDPNPRALK